MLVRFMMYLSVICPDDITIHWGNILAWNHVSDLFLSKMFPDNVATHGCFPPQKINHSIQTDNGFENLVGHMTRHIQRVHCNKQCENM